MSEEETELRVKALEAMRTGRLPDRSPDRMWGGHGNDKDICHICSNSLNREDITFDLEYDGEAAGARPACYCVHLRCFNAWDLARQQMNKGCANQRAVHPDHSRASLPNAGDVGTMTGSERDALSGNWRGQPKDPG